MLNSLASVISELNSAIAHGSDQVRKMRLQNSTKNINSEARLQKKIIEGAIKQIRAIEILALDLKTSTLLMDSNVSINLMKDWSEACINFDEEKAKSFKNSCQEWSDKVNERVNNAWRMKCQGLIDKYKRLSFILNSLNNLQELNRDHDQNLDGLSVRLAMSASAITPEWLTGIQDSISDMETKMKDLDLPAGFEDFLRGVMSLNGYSLNEFNLPTNSELREWMDKRNLTAGLMLFMKA